MTDLFTTVKGVSQNNPIKNGCVFFAPLWHPYLAGKTFRSQDDFGRLCTVTGATLSSKGRVFDGTDDTINISPAIASAWPVNGGSMICWMKRTSHTAFDAIVGLSVAGATHKIIGFMFDDGNKMIARCFQDANENRVTSTASVDTAWHLLGMTWNSSGHVTSFVVDDTSEGADTTNIIDFTIVNKGSISSYYWGAAETGFPAITVGEVWLGTRQVSVDEIAYYKKVTKGRYL